VEAANNQLTVDEYVARLNAGQLDGLVFLPPDVHVHHRDEDFTNDGLDNLEVVPEVEHGRYHALKSHNNLRYQVVPEKIVELTHAGMRATFDMCMEDPHNNFIAAGLVVHNSSNKTNLCLKAWRRLRSSQPLQQSHLGQHRAVVRSHLG
jgi:hypothetical protein